MPVELDLSNRQPLRELVYESFRQAILNGGLSPGERLIETKLAAELGISRTPIREALHKLELEGLVRPSPPRGVVVTRISPQDVEEIFEIRRLIEPYAIGLSVKVLTPEDFQLLRTLSQEAIDHAFAREPDPELISQTNVRFYNVFYDRCPNRQLGKMVRDLRDRFIFLDRNVSALTLLDAKERRAGTEFIPRVLQAALARDRSAVERLVAERLERLRAAALAHLQ